MQIKGLRLRDSSLALRLAITCFLLVLAGGYAAGLAHMADHLAKKDDEKALSLRDLIATYAGATKPAPMRVILDRQDHRAYLDEEQRGILVTWLESWNAGVASDSIEAGYNADVDYPPVDVIEETCLRCHSVGASEGDGIGKDVPLENLAQVKKYAYGKRLEPVSMEILATSTHTHALGMSAFAFLVCLLFLATGWPRFVRHGVALLCFAGLLADFAGMWLARLLEESAWIYLVLGGGALFGAMLALATAGILLHLWLGRRSPA